MVAQIVATKDHSIYTPKFNPPFQVITKGDSIICPCIDQYGKEVTVEAFVTLKQIRKSKTGYEWIIYLFCDKVIVYSDGGFTSILEK